MKSYRNRHVLRNEGEGRLKCSMRSTEKTLQWRATVFEVDEYEDESRLSIEDDGAWVRRVSAGAAA